MTACDEIGRGLRPCKELHGDVVIEPVMKEGLYLTPLSSEPSAAARCSLLKKLRARACTEDGAFSKPSAPMVRRCGSQSPRQSPRASVVEPPKFMMGEEIEMTGDTALLEKEARASTQPSETPVAVFEPPLR
mmetsp:Transcript_98997/g.258080  ORF Transcript_98997/g.258080 Transcript_98997/m.258080 type:complete len:132 (+) Transcript_98997:3-398(+)